MANRFTASHSVFYSAKAKKTQKEYHSGSKNELRPEFDVLASVVLYKKIIMS